MPSICFYFQVHQPFRLKPYDCFKIGFDQVYEDETLNREILDRVSEKCYLPANQLLLELIERHGGRFKISYSLSGVAIEQFEKYRPDVLRSFQKLAATGCVEFLSETYHHSLSFLYSKNEFVRQVEKHKSKIIELFGQTPVVFRNTELIYNNEIAEFVAAMGFKGIICEGLDHALAGRSPNFLYRPASGASIKSLLKNYKLSDDIAFRFSNQGWDQWPLTAPTFASWVHSAAGAGETINLFMDYETFGEHQWPETGIFEFLRKLPDEIFRHPDFSFKTPSETLACYDARGTYDVHGVSSWADMERDLSAWLGNDLQHDAMERIFRLEKSIKNSGDEGLLTAWSKLTTSDHFYYMSTKYWSDGDVHKYFSHYNTPFDAYINYMNVVTDLEHNLESKATEVKTLQHPPVVKSDIRQNVDVVQQAAAVLLS